MPIVLRRLPRCTRIELALPALLALALLAPALLLGCGTHTAAINLQLSAAPVFSALTTFAAPPQTVTVTNGSFVTANLGGITLSGANAGNFTQTNDCGATLVSGASCTIVITFNSSAPGSFSASLTVTDNGPFGGSESLLLTATSMVPAPVARLSAPALVFPNLAAGTPGALQTVNLTNPGTAPLLIASIVVSGPGVNLFPSSNTCGTALAVGATCNLTVGFAARVPGAYAATLTVNDNASPAVQTVLLSATATPSALTIDTTVATDWKITNGALSLDYNSVNGHIFGITLAGFPDQLVDSTHTSGGQAFGLYMDNAGFGASTGVSGFLNAGSYLDWWITYPSNSANAYTYSEHFVLTPNSPGVSLYFVAKHSSTDIAGSIGQVQWVLRENLNDFTSTYSVDSGLNNPGAAIVPLPPASQIFSTDPGRAVEDATIDLHGFTLPSGFTRSFYTKYDYSSYNYLHRAHGVFGSNIGVWSVFPSNESVVGGPTKQNLIFTGNLLITEPYSDHLDIPLSLTTPAGTSSSRLFGPFYIHFNTFGQAYTTVGNAIATPADMYADALAAGNSFGPVYDSDAQLLAAGYIPSTARGTVKVQVNGVSGAPKSAWAILSDPGVNHQLSSAGPQYWADVSATGAATFSAVIPATYRLSVYSLGQWGELRQEGVAVAANVTTTVPPLTFVPENFGTTVFTIGMPDRSSHEFLHGHTADGNDDRENWATWNFWADFAANKGAVVYNATSGSAGAATNDLSKWNYNHWGTFNPGLFAGVYNTADDTTDGYTYGIPPYVAALSGAAGTNGVTTRLPAWLVHFATPANAASFQYAVLSVALACDYGSYIATLNGTGRTWSFRGSVETDCAVRSGLSGYTQWIAFQFPVSALSAAGMDNLLSLGVSQTYGAMDDALRLELTNSSAAPSVHGWNDYEFVGTSSSANNIPANDALPNP